MEFDPLTGLPVNEETETPTPELLEITEEPVNVDETPIPVEPDGGIGDGAEPPTELIEDTQDEGTQIEVEEDDTVLKNEILDELFDEDAYLAFNEDIRTLVEAGQLDAKAHFIQFGQFEGRKCSYIFDIDEYAEKNPDVAEVVPRDGLLQHFLSFGLEEGRSFNSFFNVQKYLVKNADLDTTFQGSDKFLKAVHHYFKFGQFEFRQGSDLFKSSEYLSLNTNLESFVQEGQFSLFKHFTKFGLREFREFNSVFSVRAYLELNPDLVEFVQSGQITPVEHWLKFGMAENRNINFSFSTSKVLQVLNISNLAELDIEALIESITSNLDSILGDDTDEGDNNLPGDGDNDNDDNDQDGDNDNDNDVENEGDDDDDDDDVENEGDDDDDDDNETDNDNDVENEGNDGIIGQVPDVDNDNGGTGGDTDNEGGTGGDTDNDGDTGGDTDNEGGTGGDTDNDGDTGGDTDIDGETDNEGETDGEGGTDGDTDNDGDTDGDVGGEPKPPSKVYLDIKFVEGNTELLEKLGIEGEISSEELQDLLLGKEVSELEGFKLSKFFDTDQILQDFDAEIKEFFEVESFEGVKLGQLIEFVQKEVVEKGKSPAAKVDFQYLQAIYGETLTEKLGENATPEQILEYLEEEGIKQGLNTSVFLNFGFIKNKYAEEVRQEVDVTDSSELTDDQVIKSVQSEIIVDVEYSKVKYAVQLAEFYNLEVEEVSSLDASQVKLFVLDKEISGSVFDFKKIRKELKEFEKELKDFFKGGVKDIDDLTDGQLKAFLKVEGLKLGILKQVVDVEYLQEVYKEALEVEFGAEVSVENTLEFIFGSKHSFIDDKWVKKEFKDELKDFAESLGKKYKDLTSEEIKEYFFTEGFDAEKQLSPFKVEVYRTENVEALTQFFGVSDVALISSEQVYKYMVTVGLEQGIKLSSYTTEEVVEVYREESKQQIAEYYNIEVSEVSELNVNIIIDFVVSGLSENVDLDYFRYSFEGDVEAVFGVESIRDVSKLQIIEYLYEQEGSVDFKKINWFDEKKYKEQFGEDLEQALKDFYKDVEDISELSFQQIFKFAVAHSEEFSLDDLVNIEYLKTTYTAAIAKALDVDIAAITGEEVVTVSNVEILQFFAETEVSAIAEYAGVEESEVTEDLVKKWFTKSNLVSVEGQEEQDINYDFVRYQLTQIVTVETISTVAEILEVELTVEDLTSLSDEQVNQLMGHHEFKELLGEETKLELTMTEFDLEFVVSVYGEDIISALELEADAEITEELVIQYFTENFAEEIEDFVGEKDESDDDSDDDEPESDDDDDESDDDDSESGEDDDDSDESESDDDDDESDDDSDESESGEDDESEGGEDDVDGDAPFTDGDVLEYIKQLDITSVAKQVEVDEEYVEFQVNGLVEAGTITLEQINATLEVEVTSIEELTTQQLVKLTGSEGFQSFKLKLVQSEVDYKYIRQTLTTELAEFYEVEEGDILRGEVVPVTEGEILDSLDETFANLDVHYLKYQISQLTLEQQTQLFTELEIEVTDVSKLDVKQVIEIGFSREFKEIVEAEVKYDPIDLEKYRQENAEEIAKFYYDKKDDDSDDDSDDDDESDDSDDDDSDDMDDDSDDDDESDDMDDDSDDDDESDDMDDDSDDDDESDDMDDNSDDDDESDDMDDDSDDDDESDDMENGDMDGGVGDSNTDDMEDGDMDVADIPNKDLIKFMFGKGWENGINPLEYVDEEYLRAEFKYELAERFEIAVEKVAELPSEMIVGGLYSKFMGKFVGEEKVDVEFYKSTQKAVLEENYGVSVDELSEHQIVEHATTYGLANGLETSPINVNGLIEKYKSELSEYFEISEDKIAELDTNLVKTFALETASKLDLDVKEFVNLEYYRGLGDELVENYRVEQVYSFNYEAAYNYTSEQSVRTSSLLNTEWFRQENAQLIEENKAELDKNQNGEVDEDELTGAMKGKFLDTGFETDKSYDLDEYIQEHGDMLTDVYDKSIEQVTNREVVEFAFGAGLKAGIDPYSQDFLLERSDLELDKFIAENAQELTQYYGVTEITQIDYYQAYQYQVTFGLIGSTPDSSSEGLV